MGFEDELTEDEKLNQGLAPTPPMAIDPQAPVNAGSLALEASMSPSEASMDAGPKPIDPTVKDYLAQKYNLDQYSPDKRKEIENANAEDRKGINWAAGLAEFGGGLTHQAGAGQAILDSQEKQRQGKLKDFDTARDQAIGNFGFDRSVVKAGNEDQKLARESNPNSMESKSAQELAIKMGLSPEKAITLTAAKFKELSPVLAKMYQIDEGLKIREDDRDFKREQLATTKGMREDERKAREQARRDDLSFREQAKKDALQAKLDAQAEKDANTLTPGQKALDTSFAKEYNDWSSVGEAAVDKNITRLKDARDKLSKTQNDLVGYSGSFVGRLPELLRSEDSKVIQQDVQAAAQGALKATLGAQFTEKEGERIMKMAYDPTLSPKANMAKIDAAISELETSKNNKNQKASYFEENGSLRGLAEAKGKPGVGGAPQQASTGGNGETKMINGIRYKKVPGGWAPEETQVVGK